MKSILIHLEEKEYKKLEKLKESEKKSWKELMLSLVE